VLPHGSIAVGATKTSGIPRLSLFLFNHCGFRKGILRCDMKSEGKLFVSIAADSVFRHRAETLFSVLDQSHGTSCDDGCQTLQEALGDRVVFQVDQGKS
jgi:hypothetical protein